MSANRTLLRSLAASWCEIPTCPGHGRFVSRIAQRSANRTVLSLVAGLFLLPAVAKAEPPFCLPDADGDGHPLFGNPEFSLNRTNENIGLVLSPTSGAIGDLDGDGDADAVSTNCFLAPLQIDETDISVLLNRGDGTFAERVTYECGDYPTSVAIGDLDGDGLNDLAITNRQSAQVSILVNAGAATFPTRVSFPSGGLRPCSVVAVDLDGDEDRDLAVLHAQSDNVTILFNDGAAGFSSGGAYNVSFVPDNPVLGGDPFAAGGPYLSAGDLDCDGDIDLAGPDGDGVTVLFNDGSGDFGQSLVVPTYGPAWSIAIGDMNGDDHPDLATANYASDSVSVVLNAGDGSFAPSVQYEITYSGPTALYEPDAVSLGDVDGDGDLDLAVGMNTVDEIVLLYLNNGDGSLGTWSMVDAEQAIRVLAFEHLNGDGFIDLACFAMEVAIDKLCVLLNDGCGQLLADEPNTDIHVSPFDQFWDVPIAIMLRDFDNDGDLDAAVMIRGIDNGNPLSAPNVAIVSNLGGGSFAPNGIHYFLDFFPEALAVDHLNRDAYLDIVVAGSESPSAGASGKLAVLLAHPDGTFDAPVTYATGGLGTRSIALTDTNGDTRVDAITSNLNSGNISVLLNVGDGSLASAIVYSAGGSGPGALASGDFDGDSDPDLAVRTNAGLAILLGNGFGAFAQASHALPFFSAAGVGAADLNGDAELDLAATSKTNSGESGEPILTVMFGNGDGTFGFGSVQSLPGWQAGAVLMVDVDLDLDLDIVVLTTHSVSVSLNLGDGSFGACVAYGGTEGGGSRLDVGDIDGDADLDIARVSDGDATFSILGNRACRTSAGPSSGDFDGDGDVDLADLAVMVTCLGGPEASSPPSGCAPDQFAAADLELDGDVDLLDAVGFLNDFSEAPP